VIYFATNRNSRVRQRGGQRVYEFGDRFSEDGPEDLMFGWVDGPDQPVTQIVDSPQALKQAMDALRVRMRQEKRDLVFYLHGFRNQFEDALTAGHQLEALFTEAGYPALVCVLSWPANKSVIVPKNYFDDRDDAALSGLAMGRAFQYLIDFLRELSPQDHCGQHCHLLTCNRSAIQ
jgi:hypothetical protein